MHAGLLLAKITVYAAASLTNVFPQIDSSPQYSFGGSNTLAAQIQLGAPADVFASANTALPLQLWQKGLCTQPVVFTRNTLVLIVPKANPAGIHSAYDLQKPGVKLDVAAPGVPVGSYTRQILKNMALTSVLNNVVSNETDVREVLAKVSLGEADAGFVYVSDVTPTMRGKLRRISIPDDANVIAAYPVAVAKNAPHADAAQAFVDFLLTREGQAILVRHGFLPAEDSRP